MTVKFLLDNWMLVALAVTSGGLLLWPLLSVGLHAPALMASNAVQLINREKAVVVDVREAAEFSTGHVLGAKNIPLAQLNTELLNKVKNKAVPLILVCTTGTQSARAVAGVKALGYTQVHTLSGGVKAWAQAQLPLEKASAVV